MSRRSKHSISYTSRSVSLFDYCQQTDMVRKSAILGSNDPFAYVPLLTECGRLLILRLIKMHVDFINDGYCLRSLSLSDLVVDLTNENIPILVKIDEVEQSDLCIDRSFLNLTVLIRKHILVKYAEIPCDLEHLLDTMSTDAHKKIDLILFHSSLVPARNMREVISRLRDKMYKLKTKAPADYSQVLQAIIFPPDWEIRIQSNRHMIDIHNGRRNYGRQGAQIQQGQGGRGGAAGAGAQTQQSHQGGRGAAATAGAQKQQGLGGGGGAAAAAIATAGAKIQQGQAVAVHLQAAAVQRGGAVHLQAAHVASKQAKVQRQKQSKGQSRQPQTNIQQKQTWVTKTMPKLPLSQPRNAAPSPLLPQAKPQQSTPTTKKTPPATTNGSTSSAMPAMVALPQSQPQIAAKLVPLSLPLSQNAPRPPTSQQPIPPPLPQNAPGPGPAPPWPRFLSGKYNGPGTDPVEEVIHYNRNGQVHGPDYLPQREVEIMFVHIFPLVVPTMQEGLHSVGQLKDTDLDTIMPS